MPYHLDRVPRPYDYRALIEAYVNTKRRDYVHPDFEAYYSGLLAALEPLFEIRLKSDDFSLTQRVLWRLFENTIGSMLQITTPWSNYLEEGLVVVKVRESGEPGRIVERASAAISEAARASLIAHREMLQALFVAIFGPCDRVVSSEELRQAGFDDSREPNMMDYWQYM